METIKFKKLIPEAQTPFRKYNEDAGFDFYCTSIERLPGKIIYHTGIAVEIPTGMVGLAFPRSSVVNKDLMLKNGVGVIDATYRGEVMFIFNDTKEYSVTQRKEIFVVGDRVGQLVFLYLPIAEMVEVDELSETLRGTGGFGHSGK